MREDGKKRIKKDADKDRLEIYTPLSVAKEEIWKRWNNKELRKKVEDFLNGDIPDFLRDEPKACLGRHVVSPNNELFHFISLAQETGLKYGFIEYTHDKFILSNTNKYRLGKIFFYNGLGKNGGKRVFAKKLVDFDKFQGKKIKDTKTLCGKSLVNFHHKLLSSTLKIENPIIYDGSKWFKERGGVSKKYYLYYLSLFVCHGILFESYCGNEEEDSFRRSIVMPSLIALKKSIGVNPLIVKLLPDGREDDIYWDCYPFEIKERMFAKKAVALSVL